MKHDSLWLESEEKTPEISDQGVVKERMSLFDIILLEHFVAGKPYLWQVRFELREVLLCIPLLLDDDWEEYDDHTAETLAIK